MNVELLQKVKAAILAKPEEYNQYEWCGTAQCIAGHAVALALPEEYADAVKDGHDEVTLLVLNRKGEVLGFSEDDNEDWYRSYRLFYSDHWPPNLEGRYDNAKTPKERAQIGAERIDLFIATNGAE